MRVVSASNHSLEATVTSEQIVMDVQHELLTSLGELGCTHKVCNQ